MEKRRKRRKRISGVRDIGREGGAARVQIIRRMTRHRLPPAFRSYDVLHLARALNYVAGRDGVAC